MTMELSRLAGAVRGRLVGAGEPAAQGVSTDTRTIRPGDLFVALKGPRFDGHDFVAEALSRGAIAAVVDRELAVAAPQVVVADTTKALGDLAAAYRLALPARVVGITGSVGKTTTKEVLAHLLAPEGATVKAPASFNNLIGVPLTILTADASTRYLVVEVGINRVGEMTRLGEILRPDVAVVTTIGEAHLEGLRNVPTIAREKGYLVGALRSGGTAVLNADNPWTWRMPVPEHARVVRFGIHRPADVRGTHVRRHGDWVRFCVRGEAFRVRAPSLSIVYNALAALAAREACGLAVESAAGRLETFELPKMRMERVEARGVTFWNDAYNSNPISLRAALAAFRRAKAAGRRIAVLGDMREMGDATAMWHQEVLRFAGSLPEIDLVVAVGPHMSAAGGVLDGVKEWLPVGDAEEAARWLRVLARPGDAVLVKGSRALALERTIERFAEVA